MKIIVTGGAGFIGSAVCRYLIDETSNSVLNLDKLTYAANLHSLDSVGENPRYRFVKADIRDSSTLDQLFESFKPDAIMHLAAESHVDRSITESDAFLQTNIVGTYMLLEAVHRYWNGLPEDRQRHFRLLHVSTDEVFGSLGNVGSFREDTAYDPSSPYAASKAAADHLVQAWHRTYGLPTLISNCSNNYGPYQFPEKLIPLMIINALEGRELPVYGDGSNVRDWLFVNDHAHALYLILRQGVLGEKYNVGGRCERSNIEVVETLCAVLDRHNPKGAPHNRLITFVQDRPGHDYRYAIDASKLENELGWRAQECFETGMEKTVQWYMTNRDWWQPLSDSVYGGERLGLIEADTMDCG